MKILGKWRGDLVSINRRCETGWIVDGIGLTTGRENRMSGASPARAAVNHCVTRGCGIPLSSEMKMRTTRIWDGHVIITIVMGTFVDIATSGIHMGPNVPLRW